MKHLEQLISHLGSSYTDDLLACACSAFAAGEKIAGRDFSQAINLKDDPTVGHHAVVTEADLLAQDIIFETASRYLPETLFIGEEAEINDPRIAPYALRLVTESRLERMKDAAVVIADPLDGTAQYAMSTGGWSVSVGAVRNTKHTAGAIYAPNCNFRESGDGVLVFAACDIPAYIVPAACLGLGRPIREHTEAHTRIEHDPRKRFVYFGADAAFLAPETFLSKYVNRSWTGNMHGSCALGLSLVATGDSDCFYQPQQRVWDWAAGKLIVERAGGAFIPYFAENSGETVLINRIFAAARALQARKEDGRLCRGRLPRNRRGGLCPARILCCAALIKRSAAMLRDRSAAYPR